MVLIFFCFSNFIFLSRKHLSHRSQWHPTSVVTTYDNLGTFVPGRHNIWLLAYVKHVIKWNAECNQTWELVHPTQSEPSTSELCLTYLGNTQLNVSSSCGKDVSEERDSHKWQMTLKHIGLSNKENPHDIVAWLAESFLTWALSPLCRKQRLQSLRRRWRRC